VDSVVVLVEALLEAGEPAAAAARALPNFELAPSVERGLQLLSAQVAAGKLAEAEQTLAWLESRTPSGASRVNTRVLGGVVALAQGKAGAARRGFDEALTAARAKGAGVLQFPPAHHALAGLRGSDADAARAVLERLDALHGAVAAEGLEAALR
jgi:acetoin utilization deacetylase AcuC-like enzyme